MKEICKCCGQEIKVKVDDRSIKQNNLYWACIELLKDHKDHDKEWNTQSKCHSQIRWIVKYINKESAVHFTDSQGNSKLYFELDSIAFTKTNQKKVNAYFDDAFKYMADDLGITVEELIKEAQSRMS
jgi:hypothetical protein